jgi:hypothetical protein
MSDEEAYKAGAEWAAEFVEGNNNPFYQWQTEASAYWVRKLGNSPGARIELEFKYVTRPITEGDYAPGFDIKYLCRTKRAAEWLDGARSILKLTGEYP